MMIMTAVTTIIPTIMNTMIQITVVSDILILKTIGRKLVTEHLLHLIVTRVLIAAVLRIAFFNQDDFSGSCQLNGRSITSFDVSKQQEGVIGMFYREDNGGVQPYPGAFEGVETNEENNLKEKNLKNILTLTTKLLFLNGIMNFV